MTGRIGAGVGARLKAALAGRGHPSRRWTALVLLLLVVGCGPLTPGTPVGVAVVRPSPTPAPTADAEAARRFVGVIAQVGPVAEAYCRTASPQRRCDFRIEVDTRPGLPANAYQTLDPAGRPVIGFTLALIREARNDDELGFILGHEAGHHIAGHIPRQRDTAVAGAIIAGVLAASVPGADMRTVRSAQEMGAAIGARTYAREFELEADRIGAVIAWRAGLNPERGAAYFDRLPDPGNRFLGTHPPNAARVAVVRDTVAALRAGRLN